MGGHVSSNRLSALCIFSCLTVKGGATVGQWGQTAPIGMRLWGQNYLFAPTENQQILKGIISYFSKMLELFSGRCRWRFLTATTKGLFFQNCLSCKCQPFKVDPAASRYLLLRAGCRYSCKYPYIPIDLTLAGDFLTTGWEFRDTR